MKNYKNLIKNIKNPIWYEQQGPAIPFLSYFPTYAGTFTLRKNYPVSTKYLITFVEKGIFSYNYEENDMLRIAGFVFNKTLHQPDFLDKTIKKWQQFLVKYYKICKEIDKINLRRLNDKKFEIIFQRFSEAYCNEFSLGILADHLAVYFDYNIPILLRGVLPRDKHNKIADYFKDLTQPVKRSFLIEEKIDLLKILLYIQKKVLINKKTNIKKLAEREWKVKYFLKKHSLKYNWILNSYAGAKYLSDKYFLKQVVEMAGKKINASRELRKITPKLKNIIEKKKRLIKEGRNNKKLKTFIKLVESFSYIQDQRKIANLIATSYLITFLKELSRRTKISYKDLVFIYPLEFGKILKRKTVSRKMIQRRRNCVCLYIINKKLGVLEGSSARNLRKEMSHWSAETHIKEIKGISASSGSTSGEVKILRDPKEVAKMKNGNILVTSMTRPDFMPVVEKAKAIVTDEGGITCHAAIVSRELGIPCVIGTRIATKVLKDGDRVLVDANRGIVKKL